MPRPLAGLLAGLAVLLSSSPAPAGTTAPWSCNLEWKWSGVDRAPTDPEVLHTPIVVQLTDDDGDGRIDSGDTPDIAFVHSNGNANSDGLLTAVDGATGVEHFTTTQRVAMWSLVAGDIDGDGLVELVAEDPAREHLLAFENTGSQKWVSDLSPVFLPMISGIADLDQDGSPEIYAGATVFGGGGSHLWTGTAGTGRNSFFDALSTAADLDPGRPGLELLAGRTLYAADGSIVWDAAGLPDGWAAVADLDLDGDPEIVLSTFDAAFVLDHLGTAIAPPISLQFGQPLVADIDGDGAPEVVMVDNQNLLHAFDWDGVRLVEKWRQPVVVDLAADGASAYDFDGDGAAEVVYKGLEGWGIFDGRTGAVLVWMVEPHRNFTEVPVIADVDRDCEAEIVLAMGVLGDNTDPGNGLYVFSCGASMPARRIFNQPIYHVTNVNDDGTIPQLETPHWTANNSQLAQSILASPRSAVAVAGDRTLCAGQTARLDGAGSIPCDSVGLVYRWLDGAVEVCTWSTSPTCDVTPAVTTSYDLEVICPIAGSACAMSDRTTATVTVEPDTLPPDLGNFVRAVAEPPAAPSDVHLLWTGAPAAASYSLYRSGSAALPPPPLVENLTRMETTLADIGYPPRLWYYRVAGASCSGREGP